MLYHVSKVSDTSNTNASKECNICRYWYFLNKGFTFQPYICNGCLYILMMPLSLSVIVILKFHDVDYRCIINRISKSEAINVMQNIDSSETSRKL